MPAFHISYDLKGPDAEYDDLITAIKSFAWAHVSESSFTVAGPSLTLEAVSSALSPHLRAGDRLLVTGIVRGQWVCFRQPEDVVKRLRLHAN